MRDQPLDAAAATPAAPSLPAWRRLARWLAWLLLAAYAGFGVLVLVVRYAVLPHVDEYRDDIARMLSAAIGLRVSVRRIDARWHGLNPALGLRGLQLYDEQGRPALALEEVDAELSWATAAFGQLRLSRLEFAAPRLALRREPDGRIYVAGILLRGTEADGAFQRWLLAQPSIVVRNATLEWRDGLRGAPPLVLAQANLRLDNRGLQHRIGLRARPPGEAAGWIDLRGDFRGAAGEPLAQWSGRAWASLEGNDLAVWRKWVDFPVELRRARGALRMWLEGTGERLEAVTADLDVRSLDLRLSPELPALDLDAVSGRLSLRRLRGATQIAASNLVLAGAGGAAGEPADFLLRWPHADGIQGDLSASRLDLDLLTRLAPQLPLAESWRSVLVAAAPRGRMFRIKASWTRAGDGFDRYSLDTRFERLGAEATASTPGFSGLNGRVSADERGGSFELNATGAVVDLPALYPGAPLRLDTLTAGGSWTVRDGSTELAVRSASFANADAAGSLAGSYTTRAGEAGEVDLEAKLTRAQVTAVWRYLPARLGAPLRDWLRSALLAGKATDAKLRLKGDLEAFPFSDPRLGTFRVTGAFSGGKLKYASDWPQIDDLDGELLFEGPRMLIRAKRGRILGAALGAVSAEIPDLGAAAALVRVRGAVSGPGAEFLRFVETSPVAGMIGHYTDGVRASGTAGLQLGLDLPIGSLDQTRVEGEYRFSAGELALPGGLPPLTDASGRIRFTQNGIAAAEAGARLLGSPINLTGTSSKEGALRLDLRGTAAIAAWRARLDWPILDHLGGSAQWQARVDLGDGNPAITVESDLVGISSSLPDPFNKTAAAPLPLRVEREAAGASGGDRLRASLGADIRALVVRGIEGGRSVLRQAAIGIRAEPVLPESGLALNLRLARLDLDAWRRAFPGGDGAGLRSVRLAAGSAVLFGQTLSDCELRAERGPEGWRAAVSSHEASGDITWTARDEGLLRARFKHLAIGELKSDPGAEAGADEAVKSLPAVDLAVEDFSLRGKALGRMELTAANHGRLWRVDRLAIVNPEASLSAQGLWRPGAAAANTQMKFKLEARDAGKLLARLGYPDGVRGGKATMEGQLGWNGPPTGIDFPSLEGAFALAAEKGQFRKLDPGVGRLLGILSLQTLPRRITLDFRDVFSEGFAFDTISGSIEAKRGVLHTQGLAIRGPAATVTLSGSADLVRETQELKLRVQPSLSESLSVGAALVNPVAGLAALIAQKVLRDPLEKVFTYEYSVSGSWEEPRVEKLSSAKPANSEGGR
ncbi:MAG: hypothetical protein Fur0039_04670 [Rhodocyclaceae bacterium]